MDGIIIISAISATVGAFYAYKTFWAAKSPKIVIEIFFNNSLEVRNIGTDMAKNIKEKRGLLRDTPEQLWNFAGPLDYIREKNPGIWETANFKDDKMPKPSTSVIICFEYANTDGKIFYSEIKVDRAQSPSQIYFSASNLIKWGRISNL